MGFTQVYGAPGVSCLHASSADDDRHEATSVPARRDPRRSGELFHERGYHATGMDDIGAEAGISGPAIYRHFKGKEEILEVLLLEAAQTGLEAAREVVRGAVSAGRRSSGLLAITSTRSPSTPHSRSWASTSAAP